MSSIGVVIPTFNSENFVEDALESVLNQTIKELEVVVVDDGSTDSTVSIVKKFGNRVKIIRKENGGPGSARNLGVKSMNQEWIAFLDSDDCWEKSHIETLIASLERMPGAAVSYSGKTWVDSSNSILNGELTQKRFPAGWIFSDMIQSNYISSLSCVILSKSIFMDFGGFRIDESIHFAEDYELWLRIASKHIIATNAQATVRYRRHDKNITNQKVRYSMGNLEAVKCGIKLIEGNCIDPRNNLQTIDVFKRKRRAYVETIIDLFWLRKYSLLRMLAMEALFQGVIDYKILLRLIFSCAPTNLINHFKKLKRRDG
jgi:glycosyltransferase involved in cell wall biosynthesis